MRKFPRAWLLLLLQIELLLRLYSVPFSQRSMSVMQRVMLMEDRDGYMLRGKPAGTRQPGLDHTLQIGWLVGDGNTYLFATQVGSSDTDLPMRRAQQEITRGALRERGVLL